MGSAFFPSSMMEGTRSTLGLLPKCEKCLLYKGCKSPKMKYSGKGARKILLLGEAPGSDEDERDEQFVGESGRRLQSELLRLNINMREDCWLFNALSCRPPGNNIPKDKRENWINYCRPNVLNLLRELKPEIIIPLGAAAVQSLVKGHLLKEQGKFAISKWAGLEIPCQQLNAWIVPNYHPAYLGYEKNQALDKLFHRYLKAAVRKKGRPFLKVPDLRKQVEVIEDTTSAVAAIKLIERTAKIVAFDYETTTLRPYAHDVAKIYCCSLSTGERTIAFPWNSETGTALRRILRDKRIKKIGANMSFEHNWSAENGVGPVRGWLWDGVDGAHILDCRSGGITNVKFQGFMNYGQKSWNDSVEKFLKTKGKNKQESSGNTKNQIHKAHPYDVLLYCAVDSLVEYINAMIQMIHAGIDLPEGAWLGWQDCMREKLI